MISQPSPMAILVNVGGATAPAIHTLNEQKPRFICFFVSNTSKPSIQTNILPALQYQPEHYDWIETKAPQSLLECYRVLARKLPDILDKWGVLWNDLAVEYTSGTKPMSVAAVLVTIEHCSTFFYVGAKDSADRDRDGIGVVLDGKEYTWFQTNPWEELAVTARKEISLLFNHGRFRDAAQRARQLATVVPEDMKRIYENLAVLLDAYSQWDLFEYKTAQSNLQKALSALKLFLADRSIDPLRLVLDDFQMNADFLKALVDEKGEILHRLDTCDLISNAVRRAELAGRFDDAVARLYSALESLARYRLADAYQINNGQASPEQIPEALREDFTHRLLDESGPKPVLKLGSQDSFRLLASLGDELGQRYVNQQAELNKVLLVRNSSRLAHGRDPVKPDTYQKLFEIVMSFAGLTENDLPRFPVLRL